MTGALVALFYGLMATIGAIGALVLFAQAKGAK